MTTMVHVMEGGTKKEEKNVMEGGTKKEEKKGLLAKLKDFIPAVGSGLDKTVYVILGSLVLVSFVLTVVANAASSKPVSSVTFAVREEFPYPGMFFCHEWEARMVAVESAQNDHEYSLIPPPDGGPGCNGLEGRDGSCTLWDAGAGGKNYKVECTDACANESDDDTGISEACWDAVAADSTDYLSAACGTCSPAVADAATVCAACEAAVIAQRCPTLVNWPDPTYADDDTADFEPTDIEDYTPAGDGDALERARAIVEWFKTNRGWTAARCYVANTDGALAVSKGAESSYKLGAKVCPGPGISTFVVGGLFDPSKSVDKMFDAGFSYYFFSGYNSLSELTFTLDLQTDLSEESRWFSPKKAADFPELTQKVWHQSFSSAQLTGLVDASDSCESMIMLFDVASFLGRDMVTRNKAFSEILAEIGGAWATSALILMVFFKPVILHLTEGQPSKNKQMARWRKKLPAGFDGRTERVHP